MTLIALSSGLLAGFSSFLFLFCFSHRAVRSLTIASFLLFCEDNFLAKLQAAKEKVLQPPQSPPVKSPPQSAGVRSPPQSPTPKSPTQVPTASSGPVKSSESYKFHHSCGDNIAVMLAGKKAKRIE